MFYDNIYCVDYLLFYRVIWLMFEEK